jgi:hypothetical protein
MIDNQQRFHARHIHRVSSYNAAQNLGIIMAGAYSVSWRSIRRLTPAGGLIASLLLPACSLWQKHDAAPPAAAAQDSRPTVALVPESAPEQPAAKASEPPVPAAVKSETPPPPAKRVDKPAMVAKTPTKPTPAAKPSATPAPARAASTAAPAASPPAAKPAPPSLDLAALEQRLKDTKAIGVFTKLSLKNQVDDLLDEFKKFHQTAGSAAPPQGLRKQYDLLMLKVLSLLQDGDPQLAAAISSSREALWDILRDPDKFAKI